MKTIKKVRLQRRAAKEGTDFPKRQREGFAFKLLDNPT
jgi:hypothetical protein